MTNLTLSRVLTTTDLSNGTVVKKVGNLEAILLTKKSTVLMSDRVKKDTDSYTYLFITHEGQRVAIILKCGMVDVHFYVYPKYRGRHYLSSIIGDGFLKELWPDVRSISSVDSSQDEMIKHLAKISGFEYRERGYRW